VDSGIWHDSNDIESGLTVGSHTVEYNTITGWDTPINETVQINDGLTTTTSGTYIQQTGSLQVTILPPGAVTAGAKWRVDGGAWRDSEYTESGLAVGSHTVEYNTITGWDTPINETVQHYRNLYPADRLAAGHHITTGGCHGRSKVACGQWGMERQ
jgi:hypothetical protein